MGHVVDLGVGAELVVAYELFGESTIAREDEVGAFEFSGDLRSFVWGGYHSDHLLVLVGIQHLILN